MERPSLIVIGVLLLGMLLGAINGALVVLTKVPDIVVTLATYFVWAGFALLVRPAPGGSAAGWLKDLVVGPLGLDVLPKAAVVLVVIVAVIWIPLSRSRLGLSLYAIGSNPLAAFRSGVPVNRTKFLSYVITGFVAAFAGLSLTASTGIGTPGPGADVRADQHRRGGARRGQPGRRHRRRVRPARRRGRAPADPRRHDVHARRIPTTAWSPRASS